MTLLYLRPLLALFSVAFLVLGHADFLDGKAPWLGGRADWDYVARVGLVGEYTDIWGLFPDVSGALSEMLKEFAGKFETLSPRDCRVVLQSGEYMDFKLQSMNHIEASMVFELVKSSPNALDGGSDVMKGTSFIVTLAPFAGYERFACMLQIGVRHMFAAQVAQYEELHNANFIRHLVDTMADTMRMSKGAFPCSSDFRSFSGTCNNPRAPDWGSFGTYLRRLTKPAGSGLKAQDPTYKDGVSEPYSDRPNARAISNKVFAQGSSIPSKRVSAETVWWGQFLDHDLTLTPASGGTVSEENFNFPIPPGDPLEDNLKSAEVHFTRSRGAHRSNPYKARTQTNLQTAYVDASQVYGCARDRSHVLRAHRNGNLKMVKGMLPRNAVKDLGLKLHNEGTQDATHFAAGDARVNEQPILTAHHTLFVREHNRIAKKLKRKISCLTDEQIFHHAKKIVSAQIQYLTYEFYLPALLGKRAMPAYKGYDASVDASIDNFFATAAFRLGHSQVPNELTILTSKSKPHAQNGALLKDVFFDPDFVAKVGVEALLLGASYQKAEAIDTHVVDALRGSLFKKLTGGLDLIALNIQRGRDHGLPLYCDACELYGLARPGSFADITADVSVQLKLQSMYGTVDEVEAFVGGIAEDHVAGSELGPLFHAAVTRQFTRLRDGDRFYYADLSFSDDIRGMAEVRELKGKSLRLQDIIVRNAPRGSRLAASDFPPNVFLQSQ